MFSSFLSVHSSLLLCLLEFLSMCHLVALFLLWSTLLLPSSTTFFFFLLYILNIRSFLFLVLIPFSQLYLSFYTLHTPLLSSFFSLLFLLSSFILLGIGHTTYFLLVSQGGILVSDFYGSILFCLCILYSSHMLLLVMRALRKERVSYAFKHLVANIKSYNADKI